MIRCIYRDEIVQMWTLFTNKVSSDSIKLQCKGAYINWIWIMLYRCLRIMFYSPFI